MNPQSTTLTWGILGTGGIAKTFARGLVKSETGKLLAVGSRTQQAAEAFGQEFGVARCYASYDAVLADPDALTPARRYHIVRHAHLVRAWLADLHERSLDAALAGRPDPGSKAVAGQKGDRRYAHEEAARAILIGALGDRA